MTDENEAKEEAREKKGVLLDSLTVGSAVKEGAWKVYFNVEEETGKEAKETRAYKMLQLKKAIDNLI